MRADSSYNQKIPTTGVLQVDPAAETKAAADAQAAAEAEDSKSGAKAKVRKAHSET